MTEISLKRIFFKQVDARNSTIQCRGNNPSTLQRNKTETTQIKNVWKRSILNKNGRQVMTNMWTGGVNERGPFLQKIHKYQSLLYDALKNKSILTDPI